MMSFRLRQSIVGHKRRRQQRKGVIGQRRIIRPGYDKNKKLTSFLTDKSGLLYEVVCIVQQSGIIPLLGLHKTASIVIPEIEVYSWKRNKQRANDIPKVSCDERSADCRTNRIVRLGINTR